MTIGVNHPRMKKPETRTERPFLYTFMANGIGDKELVQSVGLLISKAANWEE